MTALYVITQNASGFIAGHFWAENAADAVKACSEDIGDNTEYRPIDRFNSCDDEGYHVNKIDEGIADLWPDDYDGQSQWMIRLVDYLSSGKAELFAPK